MKIVYIHQYYKTPGEGGAIRSYYLAQALVNAGHQVHMITAGRFRKTDVSDSNLAIHYMPVQYHNSFGFTRRIFAFIKFLVLSLLEVKKISNPDLVYATSTPLTVGLIALILHRRLKLPYIFEVRDIWPEAPIQIGAIRNKWLQKIAYALENRIYVSARDLVALSPPVYNYLKEKCPHKRIHLIPNLSDCELFTPIAPSITYNNDNPFKILYAGAIGKVNNLDLLIQEGQLLKQAKLPVQIMIAGEGSEKHRLEKFCHKTKLDNFTFLGHLNKFDLVSQFNKVQAVYVGYQQLPVLETSSPNKLFDGLAAGKLIIVNIQGWIKDLVETNRCGVFVDSNQPGQLAYKLKPLIDSPELLKSYQIQSRLIAEQHFDKKLMIQRFLGIIDQDMKITRNYKGFFHSTKTNKKRLAYGS